MTSFAAAASSTSMLALEHLLFPAVDTALRSGFHISAEQIDWFAFLTEHIAPLNQFYNRYQAQLLHAPEGFFYLLPHSTTLFPRASLSVLEVLLGKLLCLMHLNPNSLAHESIWTLQNVLEELTSLLEPERLFSFYQLRGCRGAGSAMDQAKFQERIRLCLWRFKRLGFIIEHRSKEGDEGALTAAAEFRFRITDAIFRFSAEIQEGKTLYEGQLQLVKTLQITLDEPSLAGCALESSL